MKKRSSVRFHRASVLLARAGVVLLMFVVWEIAARWFVDPMFLSPPSRVIGSLGKLFARPGMTDAFLMLMGELAISFVCSVVIGLAIALIIGATDLSRRSLMPIVLLLYGTPQITILPIVMLLAGVGTASKITFGITHGVFPVILTVAASLRDVKPILRLSARSMGASAWQRFRYILFPHMLPSFFTSLRLAMIASLLGVLLAELYASSRGIGFFTRQFTETFDPTSLFGLVLVAAAMAMAFNEILRWVQARVTAKGAWQ
ncbi:MAG: nitrate transporter permease [Hyphomicrobiales bacterium]|nr:nitrate transporter permease [Hyphomicrobiales bacterium]